MTRSSRTEGAESRRLKRLEPKPKGLLGESKDAPSCSDKNEQRSLEMISQMSATPLAKLFGVMTSLVAGNVTGGGGKATKKRPNGTMHLACKTISENFLGADRRK